MNMPVTREQILELAIEAEGSGQGNVYRTLLEVVGRFDDTLGSDHFDRRMSRDVAYGRGLALELRKARELAEVEVA